MARTLGERRMGLVFTGRTGRAWQTARKVGFAIWICHSTSELRYSLKSNWDTGMRTPHWCIWFPSEGLPAAMEKVPAVPWGYLCPVLLEHLHLFNSCCWWAWIHHTVISSLCLGSPFPPEHTGSPQQLAGLSHHGKVLSTPWGVGFLGYGAHLTDSRRQIYLNTYLPVKASSLSDSYF